MSVSRVRFVVPVALSFCLVATLAKAEARGPVALVYSMAGEASLAAPGAAPRPLRLYDRVAAGTILTAGPGARLALAYVTGKRYEISGPARATFGKGDLAERSGGVRPLPTVPPLPPLAPIAEEDRPGAKAGAVRIRTQTIPGLYPDHGAAALAEATTLHFQPLAGAGQYRIEVQDDQGRTIFQTDAASPPVRVPAGALAPGRRYQWTVRTLERPGPVARGEAEIVTLAEGAARKREATRKVLAAEGPGSLALLAWIDRSLGLLLEAREGLKAALGEEPGNPALRQALAEIEARLDLQDAGRDGR